MKNSLAEDTREEFFVISLLSGVTVFLLFTIFSFFITVFLLPFYLVAYAFLTLITYFIVIKPNIENIERDNFSAGYMEIIIFVFIGIAVAVILYMSFQRLGMDLQEIFVILSIIMLSFSTITLSLFIYIIRFRKRHGLKVFKASTWLVLLAFPFLFLISWFCIAQFIAIGLGS